ncbi:MAG: hypothetical protein ACQESJ_08485 [Bacteroidota bacterium]
MVKWFIIIVFFSSVCFNSCRSEEEKKQEKNQEKNGESTGFQTESEQTKDTIGESKVYYRFPSAKEMLSYLKTEDLRYRTDLINSVKNVEKYYSTRAKSLNLGVYLADLSYMILFGKTQEIKEYFNAIFNLSADLRINAPHEERLLEKISNNLHNPDSLVQIADQYHTEIINYLLKTGKEKTLAVISTGSYVEGLYIASHLVSDYNSQELAVKKIVNQKHAFKNLTQFAKDYSKDLNTRYSIDYLERINKHFEEFPIIEEETEVKRENDSTIMLDGGDSLKITKERFEKLKKEVNQIREEIISNQKKQNDER